MGNTLTKIAEELKQNNKKVQLIYAFNGTGKTRLSREFKELISPKGFEQHDEEKTYKILYYSAFTEDLFVWDNDLETDNHRVLKIQPNTFTDWILETQGLDQKVITNFQRYANDKLTPRFNEARETEGKNIKAFSEVVFTREAGDETESGAIKISKGEESIFVWSIFYTLLEEAISTLSIPEPDNRDTDLFNNLEYVFVDDPVSSLDENHLILLATELAELIKKHDEINFIISTHNTFFYNVLFNSLKSKNCYFLEALDDGNFSLVDKNGESNSAFSYHLHLKRTIETAIQENSVERYHFILLRNLYEKTANFLGYKNWGDLLPGDQKSYYNRIIQFSSHSNLAYDMPTQLAPHEKQLVSFLLKNLVDNYGFMQETGSPIAANKPINTQKTIMQAIENRTTQPTATAVEAL